MDCRKRRCAKHVRRPWSGRIQSRPTRYKHKTNANYAAIYHREAARDLALQRQVLTRTRNHIAIIENRRGAVQPVRLGHWRPIGQPPQSQGIEKRSGSLGVGAGFPGPARTGKPAPTKRKQLAQGLYNSTTVAAPARIAGVFRCSRQLQLDTKGSLLYNRCY